MKVTGLDSYSGNGSTFGFPPNGSETVTTQAQIATPPGEMGPIPFVIATSGANKFVTSFIGAASSIVDCDTGTTAAPGTFSFNGGPLVVTISTPSGTLLQTYNITFPPQANFPVPHLGPLVNDGTTSLDFRTIINRFGSTTTQASMLNTWICGMDTVRSMALIGDPRIVSTLATIPTTKFAPVVGYDDSTIRQSHGILEPIYGASHGFVGAVLGKYVKNCSYSFSNSNPYAPGNAAGDFYYTTNAATTNAMIGYTPGFQPLAYATTSPTPKSGVLYGTALNDPTAFITNSAGFAIGANGVYQPNSATLPGDWDNGMGLCKDGAYINKADEGAIPYNVGGNYQGGYFGGGYTVVTKAGSSILFNAGSTFSPNRQMPSAGMFGSLPSGAKAGRNYQTLLFRPDPDGTKTHIGAQSPPDYLLLDLFNMPIVEPYAISDPFSTAGKVNMNYQILPFTYITRSTAVQAVMRPEQVMAIADNQGNAYKNATTQNYRFYLDIDKTLTGFSNRFGTGDIFRSAGEICSIWLVPVLPTSNTALPANQKPTGTVDYNTAPTAQTYWTTSTYTGLTGDNVREKPYTNLYPRLTTKSNSYTVHMRVQTLKKIKGTDSTQWLEGTDLVTGEYRGSSSLERYLDTSDTTIPDYATGTQPPALPIDNFYKFRVVETKQFTP